MALATRYGSLIISVDELLPCSHRLSSWFSVKFSSPDIEVHKVVYDRKVSCVAKQALHALAIAAGHLAGRNWDK